MRTTTRGDALGELATIGLAVLALGRGDDDAATEDATSEQGQETQAEAQAMDPHPRHERHTRQSLARDDPAEKEYEKAASRSWRR